MAKTVYNFDSRDSRNKEHGNKLHHSEGNSVAYNFQHYQFQSKPDQVPIKCLIESIILPEMSRITLGDRKTVYFK